jgi:hypothetical protein
MTPRGGRGVGVGGAAAPPDLSEKKGPVENGRAKGHSLTDLTIKSRAQNAFNALSTAAQASA